MCTKLHHLLCTEAVDVARSLCVNIAHFQRPHSLGRSGSAPTWYITSFCLVVVRIIAYRAGGFQLAIAPVYHIAATQESNGPLPLAVAWRVRTKKKGLCPLAQHLVAEPTQQARGHSPSGHTAKEFYNRKGAGSGIKLLAWSKTTS